MQPFISVAFDGPQLDDILGATTLYGDAFGCNDSPAQAASLGYIRKGSRIIETSTLDAFFTIEEDFYEFETTFGNDISIEVEPIGFTYFAGAQNPDGSCQAGAPFDALRQLNLNVELLDSDGATVLASGVVEAAGDIETIDIDLSAFKQNAATSTRQGRRKYFIRVFADPGGPFVGTQAYNLRLVIDETIIPTLSQWGLFIFALMMVNLGITFIRRKERDLA